MLLRHGPGAPGGGEPPYPILPVYSYISEENQALAAYIGIYYADMK